MLKVSVRGIVPISFPFDFESNGIPFGSKSIGKLIGTKFTLGCTGPNVLKVSVRGIVPIYIGNSMSRLKESPLGSTVNCGNSSSYN